MHGFNKVEQYLRIYIADYDLWCIQEHWLYPCTIREFKNISNDSDYMVICSVEDNDVMFGRPKGGIALLRKKSFASIIKYIGNSMNNRVMC